MAEYSRLASGKVISNGVATNVIIPFVPQKIRITNVTRLSGTNSGVSQAWWNVDMGQGAAALTTTTNATSDLSAFVDATGGANSTSGFTAGTGFSTFQGGLSFQYGATQLLGGSGGITKASAAVVTTTSNHNLVSGNVVIFSNLYQTSTTGMQQIAGIPFVITRTGATTFTIPWNTNQSNYTAISAGGLNANASFKQVLFPSLYVPGTSFVSAITTGTTTTIDTTAPHNLVVGQEVGFRIPSAWGTTQLNELPNVLIPGSPMYGFVTAVNSSTEVVVNINSTGYTAFNSNQTFASFPGLSFPQMVAVGDNNTGSLLFGFSSPTVYNGYGTTAVSTTNGPAVSGAYINNTMQGFIIGSAVGGSSSDVIYWEAMLMDLSL